MEITSGKHVGRVKGEKALLQRTKEFQSACIEMHTGWEPRGARASQMDTELQHHWHNWDMADQFAGLECYDGQVQTLQEKQAEKKEGVLPCTWRSCLNIWSSSTAVCLTTRAGVCYGPFGDCEVDETSFKKLENISRWYTLLIMGDFKPPDIC